MIDCFAFRFFEPDEEKRKSLAIFFTSDVSLDSVAKAIKADVEENLTPKNVLLLSIGMSGDDVSKFNDDKSFLSEFQSFVGSTDEKLKYLLIKPDGDIRDATTDQSIPEELKQRLMNTGAITLFKKRKGLFTSSPSYHFVKPSGDHCDKFIRASNLLTSGVEVSFLAVSLLSYLKNGIKRIYVDSSSISYLISTAILLSEELSAHPPLIESFESYAAFNQKYDFVESEDSIVVISATTSGSLAKKLLDETSFTHQQVITLFYTEKPEDQVGIFDISSAVPSNINSFKPTDCSFCKHGSMRIRIVGDQFLPETPKHELLIIKKTDFDKERSAFFKDFATRNVLGWNVSSDPQAEANEHFFIDVVQVLADPPQKLSTLLDKQVKRHVARDVKTVIRLNDAGSEAFSNKIKEMLGDDANHITWLRLADLDEKSFENDHSVIVIAGAITSGRKLLDASRKLRRLHQSAFITYIVGFSKLPTNESFEQLGKDLKQGGHEFIVLRKCPLPRIKNNMKTAWDWEFDKLNEWSAVDPLSEQSRSLPEALSKRADILKSSSSASNQLFFNNPKGGTLKLRPTFAFWSDLELDTEQATQADVYWTIQSILHDLRLRSDEKGLASTYHTTLISPACFDRYNDGVIQACLLRAAKPSELNYAIDDDFSRKMTDVVLSVLDNWDNDQGEGALEFLIAIWTGRMKLIDEHIKDICALDKEQMPDEMRFILEQLRNMANL